jgi:hypothetical protein
MYSTTADPLLTTKVESAQKELANNDEVFVKMDLYEMASFVLTTLIVFLPGASVCKVYILLYIHCVYSYSSFAILFCNGLVVMLDVIILYIYIFIMTGHLALSAVVASDQAEPLLVDRHGLLECICSRGDVSPDNLRVSALAGVLLPSQPSLSVLSGTDRDPSRGVFRAHCPVYYLLPSGDGV